MPATARVEPSPVGSSVRGSGPHVEELHGFFASRGVAFGAPEDLQPFVERLDSDEGFHDEMASMMRTIIYRERDGLSWSELMELLAAAVGGPAVDDSTAPQAREAVRRLMVFMESVFRTRRNPGASRDASPQQEQQEQEEPKSAEAPAVEETVVTDSPEAVPAPHPVTDLFYRARMAAQSEEEKPLGRIVAEDAEKTETVLLHREASRPVPVQMNREIPVHIPLEHFGEQETERRSSALRWVAGICALLLSFCAGLLVHQRIVFPQWVLNKIHAAPSPAVQKKNPQAAPATSGAQPAETPSAAANAPAAQPSAPPAQANNASDASDASSEPKYLPPATIGASPAVMAAHLVYAPPPAYPMRAEMTRTEGKVMVEAVVGKDGRVIRARAISGHQLLRAAALREVYARRYQPYTVRDRPIDVATIVTVDFHLKQ